VFLGQEREGWSSKEGWKKAIEESHEAWRTSIPGGLGRRQPLTPPPSRRNHSTQAPEEENLSILRSVLREKMELFRLSSVVVFSAQGEELARITASGLSRVEMPTLNPPLSRGPWMGRTCPWCVRKGRSDFIEGIVPSGLPTTPRT
jgi:hypothetical protein